MPDEIKFIAFYDDSFLFVGIKRYICIACRLQIKVGSLATYIFVKGVILDYLLLSNLAV